MSIPFIVEVAIGLVFIYLILSLVASEIQDIISTLLQWKAEHLKRSIEVLLAGNDAKSKEVAQAFANKLYQKPLIRSLNQEATGTIGRAFRLITQAIGAAYRQITRTRNAFGSETSGPSYIPSEAFSQALLESLQLEDLRKILLQSRVRQLIEERLLLPLNHMVNDLRASTANEFLLSTEFRDLEQSISQLVGDFKEKRTTLIEAVDRLLLRIEEFEQQAKEVLPENHHLTETFLRRIRRLRGALASTPLDKTALLKTLQPTLNELVSVLDNNSAIYRELKRLADKEGGLVKTLLANVESQPLPAALRASLLSLAEKTAISISTRARITVKNAVEEPLTNATIQIAELGGDIRELGQEVEAWFNRGMDRAAGVYNRNAKAVGLIIGVAIAIALNADSLHIIDRLSRDPAVRQVVSQVAEQSAASTPEELEDQVESLLDGLPIPLGYGPAVTTRQLESEAGWFIPFIPRRVVGWLITGIAISMGSKFWFGLLKRVVERKNSVEDRAKAP